MISEHQLEELHPQRIVEKRKSLGGLIICGQKQMEARQPQKTL